MRSVTFENGCTVVIFPSALGWMGMVGSPRGVRYLTFGHNSAQRAADRLGEELGCDTKTGAWRPDLVARLQRFARGEAEDFADVSIDLPQRTPFQRAVVRACRGIAPGETQTYAQLATAAGRPTAARAVGNCMAANPLPLIVPCHRVVPSSGGLGGYSAPGGIRTKRRLLQLERSWALAAAR